MDEVVPGLYIGPWEMAFEVEELERAGVTHILSAMRMGALRMPEGIKHVQLPILDSPKFDILMHLPRAVDFVDDALRGGGRVLVHCQAGISRSATVVAAYLIASRGVSVATALETIRKARPRIQPNFGFIQQLDTWHASKCIVSVEHKPTRLHFIEKTVRSVKAGRGVHIHKEMLAAAAVRASAGVGSRIRCKMCRRELASRDHLFPHGPAHTQEPANGDAVETASESLSAEQGDESATRQAEGEREAQSQSQSLADTGAKPPPSNAPLIHAACSGYFVEPLEWMRPFLDEGSVDGKIVCPNEKCKAKLGSYAWAGVKCACGEWVTPGFCIHRSKVDEMR